MEFKPPFPILKEAIKSVPVVKYALGIAGLGAAIAILKQLKIENYHIPLLSVLTMLGLMILLYIFSVMTKSRKRPLEIAGWIMAYTVLFVFVMFCLVLTSSTLFDYPKPINEYKFFHNPANKKLIEKQAAISHIEEFGLSWNERDKAIIIDPATTLDDSIFRALLPDFVTLQPDALLVTFNPRPRSTFEQRGQWGLSTLGDLNKVTSLTTIKIKNSFHLTDIRAISQLKNLTGLNLDGCFALENIDAVRALTSLEAFSMKSALNLRNLDGLQNLPNLQMLDLEGCNCLYNVDALTRLNKLRVLTVSVSKLVSLDGLNQCTKLEQLDAHRCVSLKNVDGLAGLKHLWFLNLNSCYFLNDIRGLKGLTELKKLNLGECGYLTNIEPLKDLKNLEFLALTRCANVENLGALKSLTKLKELYLQGCSKIRREDVEDLKRSLPNTNIYF